MVKDEDGVGEEGETKGDLQEMVFGPFFDGINETEDDASIFNNCDRDGAVPDDVEDEK